MSPSQSCGPLFGDGNPPDFSSWGRPTSPAPASLSVDPYVARPAVAATSVAPILTASLSGDPIAVLDASQKASVDAIAAAISDLAKKTDASWVAETVAGSPATLDARDAPGSSNVAWLSSLCVQSKVSSLTIFNGPLSKFV
jgi:hypothetical protein